MPDFSALKPYLDINKFSPEQLTELQRGLDLDLDFFTYANPAYSAEEMLIYRTFLETAKTMGPVATDLYVITDYGPEKLTQGFTSYSNYKKYPDRICYVPENWDFKEDGPGYTAKDILTLCNGDQDLADMVFGLCDWQHPSTILGEWDKDDAIALIQKKEAQINALQEDIIEIRKEFEEDLCYEACDNSKPVSEGLIFHIEEQIKEIQIHKDELNKRLSQGGKVYQYSAQLLSEAQGHLIDLCKGASLALEEESILEYLAASNQVSIMDHNYQKIGAITVEGYTSAVDLEKGSDNVAEKEVDTGASVRTQGHGSNAGKSLDTIINKARSSQHESGTEGKNARGRNFQRE